MNILMSLYLTWQVNVSATSVYACYHKSSNREGVVLLDALHRLNIKVPCSACAMATVLQKIPQTGKGVLNYQMVGTRT